MKANIIKILLAVGKIIGVILIILLVLFASIMTIYMFTEYVPNKIEDLEVQNKATKTLKLNDEISVLTYNVGYFSLDKTQDFFMDGGKGVMPKTKNNMMLNLKEIKNIINKNNTDICLLQEVDINSKRSYFYNQYEEISKSFNGTSVYSMYHKALYIPYPINNMVGHVEAGMVNLNKFNSTAQRISLPNAYTFPMRPFMFKRNLLKQEIDIEGTNKKLIVINVHMEAYDKSDTRKKQLEELKLMMEEEYKNGNYVIVGGDFNQTFPGIDEKKYPVIDDKYYTAPQIPKDYLPEGFVYAVDDKNPTCRLTNKPYSGKFEDTQLFVVDGYMISSNLELKKVETINTNFEYSDHQPVMLQVKLKE